MTRFVWVGCIVWANPQQKNCGLGLNAIFSIEVAAFFNYSMIIGYKINFLCREINSFAMEGNLASENAKRCHSIVICSIWVITAMYLTVHLFLNFYWTLGNERTVMLNHFDFMSQCMQVIIFSMVSIMYLFSIRQLLLLKKNIVSSDKPLQTSTAIVWVIFFIYVFLALTLAYTIYTLGLYNW